LGKGGRCFGRRREKGGTRPKRGPGPGRGNVPREGEGGQGSVHRGAWDRLPPAGPTVAGRPRGTRGAIGGAGLFGKKRGGAAMGVGRFGAGKGGGRGKKKKKKPIPFHGDDRGKESFDDSVPEISTGVGLGARLQNGGTGPKRSFLHKSPPRGNGLTGPAGFWAGAGVQGHEDPNSRGGTQGAWRGAKRRGGPRASAFKVLACTAWGGKGAPKAA